MAYLLDTCALIAYLTDEAGADEVEQALAESECHTHALMLYELYKDTLRRTSSFDEADQVLAELSDIGLMAMESMEEDILKEAAAVRLSSNPMALVDAFGVAICSLKGLTFLTSDRRELEPVQRAGRPIRFFRNAVAAVVP